VFVVKQNTVCLLFYFIPQEGPHSNRSVRETKRVKTEVIVGNPNIVICRHAVYVIRINCFTEHML